MGQIHWLAAGAIAAWFYRTGHLSLPAGMIWVLIPTWLTRGHYRRRRFAALFCSTCTYQRIDKTPGCYRAMKTSPDLIKFNHIENLTWLRAIAAFFVVVSHSLRTAEAQYAPDDAASHFLPVNFLDLGSFGVCLFFALSGCTLYLSNSATINSTGDVFGFYAKRFMRIWPTFAFSMMVYLLFIEVFRVGYAGDQSFWVAQFLQEYTIKNIFQYLSLTFNVTGPPWLFITPYWSLPVEFQYYLIMPLAILLMPRRLSAGFVPMVFGAVLYVFYKYPVVPMNVDDVFHLGFVFFGGVMLAHLRMSTAWMLSAATGLMVFILATCLVGFYVMGWLVIPANIIFISDEWNYYGVSALICVAAALFSRQPVIANWLRSILNEYGDVSYSIYLFHMLFLGIAAIAITQLGIYGNLRKLAFVLGFTLVFTFLFSKWTYKFIELPSIRLGRKLSTQLSLKRRK
jgi:peptidoglycan/LPS O-acetylase OafA/YrhL